MYCELQLEVIYMQIDGAAELTHVPNNWSTFWKRPVPATLVWRGIKKMLQKQNENFEINIQNVQSVIYGKLLWQHKYL